MRDIDTDIWYGVYVPARTPSDVVAKLNKDVNAALKKPEVAEALAKQGLQPTGGTPAELEKMTRTDLERWSKVVREANIQPD